MALAALNLGKLRKTMKDQWPYVQGYIGVIILEEYGEEGLYMFVVGPTRSVLHSYRRSLPRYIALTLTQGCLFKRFIEYAYAEADNEALDWISGVDIERKGEHWIVRIDSEGLFDEYDRFILALVKFATVLYNKVREPEQQVHLYHLYELAEPLGSVPLFYDAIQIQDKQIRFNPIGGKTLRTHIARIQESLPADIVVEAQ